MENLPLLVPLVILFPSFGAFINIFWGSKLTERMSASVGITAAILSFIVSVFLFVYASATHGTAAVINPPLLDGWIRIDSIGLDIPWQLRVDTLTIVMLLVVTGVGSLIHIYSYGYMHGDPKFSRFFAFLNMFLGFMLTLVTANNFLMMFVGWEGVGLCSFLLIGFWWDKKAPEGWKNSNAARKAFIVNRIGDFGILMATFLIFWTFGTLNYYSPGEIANVPFVQHLNEADHGEEGDAHAEETGEHGEETAVAGEEHSEEAAASEEHAEEGDTAEEMGETRSAIPLGGEEVAEGEDHGEEAAASEEHAEVADDHATEGDDHAEAVVAGDEHAAAEDDGYGGHGEPAVVYTDNEHIAFEDLGVFNKVDILINLPEGDPAREVNIGPFTFDIETVIAMIVVFMLLGATGKSAQIPLFVWLPDAMAGPTPVSALIHAATMVTAGVYLMVRSNVLLDAAPEWVNFLIAMVGALTALMAGYVALGQWDIKRVLAYSTISQLGFMVAAVGIGGYTAAIFHLATHAVFKALLFLGSGSVIHGVEHGHHHAHEHAHGHDDHHDHHDEHEEPFDPQDMRNMGGLASRMPITFVTYIIGTLALAGIPPLAGFWSKDEILGDAWHVGFVENSPAGFLVLIILLLAAGMTAFYMWRQIEMVFFGEPRSEAANQAPESAASMTFVLSVLAFFTVIVGFINVPRGTPIVDLFFKEYEFKHFIEPSVIAITRGEVLSFNVFLATVATLIGLGAIFLARQIYGKGHSLTEDGKDPLQVNAATRQIWSLANARLYWDEIYGRLIEQPFNRLGQFLADTLDWKFWHDYFHNSIIKRGFDAIASILSKPLDLGVIDGAVNGVGWLVRQSSSRLRKVQTGYVRVYAVALLFGVVAVVLLMLLPLIQNGS